MSALTEPIAMAPLPAGAPKTPREWLDALSAGACDQDSFLRAATELFQKSPDACWEVLSLLDQYYRLGKIKFDLFQSLQSHLQSVAIGVETNTQVSVPLPSARVAPREAGNATPISAARPRLAAQPAAPIASPPNPPGRATDTVAREKTAVATPEERRGEDRAKPAVGDLLRGRYRLQRVLGKGGKGTVFEAVDEYRGALPMSSQALAIKVLHSSVTGLPEVFTELLSEFRHLQSLSHPNIVRVHEFDRDGDTAFFTMELLSGTLLSQLLLAKHGIALDRSHAFEIVRDVGDALAHAHSHGIVHGDVSPQNIFITDEGEVRVLDFGAAHAITTGPGPWISDFESQPRFPVAAPSYASCELLEGQHPDARDDLYALACIAYVLLTGDRPFKKRTAIEARTLRLRPPRPAGLSRQQWQALRAGLSFERDRRPSDFEEWLRRLDLRKNAARLPALSVLLKPQRSRRRFRPARAITAAVLLMLVAALWATTDYESPASLGARLRDGANIAMGKVGAFITRTMDAAPNGTDTANDAAGDSAASAVPSVGRPPAATPGAASTATAPASNTAPKPVHAAARTPAAPPAASAAPVRAGNAPLARIEFAQDSTEVLPGDSIAQVSVRRKGNLRSDATFTWWTESGTAKAGIDFVAVAPRVEHFDAGKDRISLIIPVVYDSKRRLTKNFYAVIDQPGPGAALGARTLAMVSIVPSD